MTWQPIVLIGFGGFLIGGVAAAWKSSRVVAGVLALFALLLIAGGVLWIVGE